MGFIALLSLLSIMVCYTHWLTFRQNFGLNENMEFLELTLFSNTLRSWIIALALFVGLLLALILIKKVWLKRAASLESIDDGKLDGLVIRLLKQTRWIFILAVSANLASLALHLPEASRAAIRVVTVIILLVQGGLWGNGIIAYWINRKVKKQMEMDAERATTLDVFGLMGRIVLWIVVVLLILDNLPGIQVTTLIASLGITGIAVALAVQNILGDLFSSFTIVMDKPFVIGDFIIVDEYRGTVEHIGLKSTRIRSLTGEQLIFSNSDLLNSRVRNFKRMARRRILFNLGVTYQTPAEKLAIIPALIREIVEKHPDATFDRAHFSSYGAYSLDFEIVYWVDTPDYYVYMDIQQDINLEIYRCFTDIGVEFAYPTQTLFMEKQTPQALNHTTNPTDHKETN
jgi:small-conductance mechanosensitive channel